MNKKIAGGILLIGCFVMYCRLLGLNAEQPASASTLQAGSVEKRIDRDSLIQDVRQLSHLLEAVHPDPYIKGGGKIAFHWRMQQILAAIPGAGMKKMQFYRLLLPFIASIGDAHTRLVSPCERDEEHPGGVPLYFRVVEKCLVVERVHEQDHKGLIGSILASVEGVPVGEIQKRMGNYFAFENEHNLLASIGYANGLWWKDIVELLIPEWKDKSKLKIGLKKDDGRENAITIEVPAKVRYPLISKPTHVALPPTARSSFAWNFADKGKKTALLEVRHMSGFRERFEILRSMGRANIEKSANEYYRQYHHREPPADADGLIKGIPSAAEVFYSMLMQMKEHKAENLIVDLRSNNGGSSAMAEILCCLLYGEQKFLKIRGDTNEITKYSDYYFALHAGETLAGINQGRPVELEPDDYDFAGFHPPPGRNDDGQSDWRKRVDSMPSFKRMVSRQKGIAVYSPKRVFVLCSPQTFSSGFTFMRYLHLCGAQIVGTPSGQAGNCFGSILEFTLDHSGLAGHVSHKYFEDFPPGSEGSRSLNPDYLLPYDKFAEYEYDPNSEMLYALEIINNRSKTEGSPAPTLLNE